MHVFAADAASGGRDLSDRLFKLLRQRQNFAGAAIKGGGHLSPQSLVFPFPDIDSKHSSSAPKEQLRVHPWANSVRKR
jgi:hypothetical protein